MKRPMLPRIVMLIGAVILLAAAVPLSQPYRHGAAWRVSAEDQSFVDRAVAGGGLAFGLGPEEYRRITRPRVGRDGDQTCVTLATHRSDGGGSYAACYNSQTGSAISERATGCTFGVESLWDRWGQWIW